MSPYFGGIWTSTGRQLNTDGTTSESTDFYITLHKSLRESGLLAELKGAPLGVLLSLMLYAGSDAEAWPSAYRLGQDTGYHENTVLTACAKLEAMGWIERRQERHEDGTWSHTVYTIKSPEALPGKGSNRDTKNRARFNRGRLIVDEGVSSHEEVSNEKEERPRKEEPAKKGSDNGQVDPLAVSSSSLVPLAEKIHEKLTQKDAPTKRHLEKLAQLADQYGDDLPEIINFALADFIPDHPWMEGRPLAWGTVMHLLGDAAAAWEGRQRKARERAEARLRYCLDCSNFINKLYHGRASRCEECGGWWTLKNCKQVKAPPEIIPPAVYCPECEELLDYDHGDDFDYQRICRGCGGEFLLREGLTRTRAEA